MPSAVNQLAFSPDGRRLGLRRWPGGLRLYDRDQGWGEVARDEDYRDQSYGAAFAPDGRLVTTAIDGKVRLYAADLKGTVRPILAIDAPGGHQPYGIAFNPDGMRLAVGYNDTAALNLLDGRTLARLPRPRRGGIANGNLGKVAWSLDGQTLFAAGAYRTKGGPPVVAWGDAGAGKRRNLPAAQNTVKSLVPLPDGDLWWRLPTPGSADCALTARPSGSHGPPQAHFGGLSYTFSVSDDGTRIGFGFALEAPAISI